jgi:hypothetical protein
MIALVPFTLGATDPAGDAEPCRQGRPVGDEVLDVASAQGLLIENAMALEFRVRFHGRPVAPDPGEPPFRIDIVLKDPRVPTFSFGPYRDINRIIRFDATDPPRVAILLLAEQSISQPSTYVFEDGSLRLTVAGRLLGTEAENLENVPLEPLRWNVVAREGASCDWLGSGRPVLRLRTAKPAAPTQTAPASPSREAAPAAEGGSFPWIPAIGVALAAGATVATAAIARRRR